MLRPNDENSRAEVQNVREDSSAIQNGFDAFFTTAATLIDVLSAAFRAGQLADALPAYTHPAVLVVDEGGHLKCGTDAANMLFTSSTTVIVDAAR